MTTTRRTPPIARTVDAEQADAALLEAATRLRAARESIATLLTMENARTPDLHSDDDHIRRMIGSMDAKRRRLRRDAG
jgi:acyl-CoA reductase-like NAD-dependent aldehyde dehydrogenase